MRNIITFITLFKTSVHVNESSFFFFILWKETACRIKQQKIITAFWLYSASRLQEVAESHAANVAGLPKVVFWREDRHSNNWHLWRGGITSL